MLASCHMRMGGSSRQVCWAHKAMGLLMNHALFALFARGKAQQKWLSGCLALLGNAHTGLISLVCNMTQDEHVSKHAKSDEAMPVDFRVTLLLGHLQRDMVPQHLACQCDPTGASCCTRRQGRTLGAQEYTGTRAHTRTAERLRCTARRALAQRSTAIERQQRPSHQRASTTWLGPEPVLAKAKQKTLHTRTRGLRGTAHSQQTCPTNKGTLKPAEDWHQSPCCANTTPLMHTQADMPHVSPATPQTAPHAASIPSGDYAHQMQAPWHGQGAAHPQALIHCTAESHHSPR